MKLIMKVLSLSSIYLFLFKIKKNVKANCDLLIKNLSLKKIKNNKYINLINETSKFKNL